MLVTSSGEGGGLREWRGRNLKIFKGNETKKQANETGRKLETDSVKRVFQVFVQDTQKNPHILKKKQRKQQKLAKEFCNFH